jgi:hypothetical protein
VANQNDRPANPVKIPKGCIHVALQGIKAILHSNHVVAIGPQRHRRLSNPSIGDGIGARCVA